MIPEIIIRNTTNIIKEDFFLPSGEFRHPTTDPKNLGTISEDMYDVEFIFRAYTFLASTIYTPFYDKDKKQVFKELSSAKATSHLVIKTFSKNLCSCRDYIGVSGRDFSRKMIEIIPLLTPSVISSDWEEVEELSCTLIDSLNAKNCIISRGQPDAVIAWFTLKLLSKVFNIEIDKRKPFFPKKDKFVDYQNVLDNWNTEDMIELDKMVYILCDLHMKDAEDNTAFTDYFLDESLAILFPYEVIILLKLRERAGLENFQYFSHPLVHTPIMKTLLNIEEPLPTPQPQEDLVVFLNKLQEMCPDNDVEIPEWLETMTHSNAIPDDFINN